MLSKKLAIAAASAALVMGAFAPMAFANVNVTNGGAVIVNTDTQALSGGNQVTLEDNADVDRSNINLGGASASTVVGTELNNNVVSVTSNTLDDGKGADVNVKNCGFVEVNVDGTVADSGDNHVRVEGELDGSNVTTGAASASTNVQSLVNVNSVTVSGNNVTE